MQINEVINELNNLALSLDRPQPLIKWSIMTAPHVIDLDFICIVLFRIDSALFNYGSVLYVDDYRLAAFKNKVNDKIRELTASEFIREEGEFLSLESFAAPKDNSAKEIKSFYIRRLEARQETIGYIAIGSLKENVFLKYRLNIFNLFCNQFGIGMISLINKNEVLEQKRLLEEARNNIEEEKKKTETIIEGMQEGLILFDKDNAVISVNKAAIQILGLDEDYKIKSASRFILDAFKSEIIEKNIKKKDIVIESPKKTVIRVNSAGITDRFGQPVGRAVMLQDITKEKEAEQMKSDFVSAVSHELRTPLTSMREAISLMVEEITGPVNEKQKRCLTVALEDTDRLARIINNLLSMSRIEAGKARSRRISVDLKQVVSHLISSFEAYAKSKGIGLVDQIENGLPHLFADPDQLIQVLTNLIGNAMKFTPIGGKITVSAQRTVNSEQKKTRNTEHCPPNTGYVQISVKDTGPGITLENQGRLFKKFSQLDTGLTRKPGGTGLGLVISKDIVERHGGRIWVESEPGRGSIFSFVMPIFSEDSEYIEMIQQNLDLVRESGGYLAVALLCPALNHNGSAESDDHLAGYLIQKCRDTIVRKEDIITGYRKNRVFIVAPEVNMQGMQRMMDRIKEVSKVVFKTHIAVYPDDGVTAEELFRKVISEQ